ncbi:MAG: slipin family protein [Candidatus Tectomicrobia bacterium]|nr:slipin family protein [Candidatus Tectomicrobia bacterium]
MLSFGTTIFLVIIVILLLSTVKVVKEYERAVILRLGRLHKAKGPGLIILLPMIDRMFRISLRLVTMDVPPQDVITRDNVSVKVNAVVYFRVMAPDKAVIVVEDYLYATSQLAQTTLRSILGQVDLDDLLSNRDEINEKLQHILDESTDPWGIKVTNVEVKHVDLPQEMQGAIARQAVAERDRRAKVIHAKGEFEAAAQLGAAADIITAHPAALQLRFLQTLTEIGAENNTTTIFPLPIELLRPFLALADAGAKSSPPTPPA